MSECSSSESEETLTAAAVLRALEAAWRNERLAPEVLPHQSELVECMMQQIQHMQANVDRLAKSDVRVAVHAMELSRIRYLVSSYLRARLRKIETFGAQLVGDEAAMACLSAGERDFCRTFVGDLRAHLGAVALERMPPNMHADALASRPDLDAHVFFEARRALSGIVLEGLGDRPDEEIDLDEGSQHILRYKSIAAFVKAGHVQLI